ncbi:MAG: histidine phosphatase family protein [Bryobacterales bacterium]
MTLYLARHGLSLGRGLFLGQSDPELSEEGRAQSTALAERLADADQIGVYSSTLRRSIDTATAVAVRRAAVAVRCAVERDWAMGVGTGSPGVKLKAPLAGAGQRKLDDWWGVTPEGGEPRDVSRKNSKGV